MTGENGFGVTLSRTLIPTLPPGYLSRKRLFPLIENDPSGTTLVIAPAGYGKSALVAEWAQQHSDPVIWMTVANGDSINEMSAMMIAATRHLIPDFAPWFERDHPIRPTEVVRRWSNELLQTGRNYVFVLDNLRNMDEKDVDIAVQLIEQFPTNVHLIAIRKSKIDEIYATSASRGPLKVIGTSDLRFAPAEIDLYATNSGLKLSPSAKEYLRSANGWPAATALLLSHLQERGAEIDISEVMTSEIEPLRALAMIVLNGLDAKVFSLCERLAIVEQFSLEVAQLILGEDYDYDLIASLAHKGEIFTQSRDPLGGFTFSPMLRQIFLEHLRKNPALTIDLHKKLLIYFEKKGQPSAAIEHAFEAGDSEKISELFPNAARAKQAQGKGGELMRWAKYAYASAEDGELKGTTVMIAGLLADLDFSAAQSEITKLVALADSSPASEFFFQYAAGASCYSLLSLGKFAELEQALKRTKLGTAECYLGVDDQINLYRLQATARYIWSDADGVEEVFRLASELVKGTSLYTSHTFVLAIQAMHLHQRGEYRKAFEIASMALAQYQKFGFVGNHGPLDAMYVIARTQLEFSKTHDALILLEQIRTMADQWRQWHWYLASEKHTLEYFSFRGNHKEALDRIKHSREVIATLEPTNQLATFIDFNELNVRRKLGDLDNLEKLINRLPETRDTQIHRMALDEFRGRKTIKDDAKKLPDNNPRDRIWKFLTEASYNIDSDQIALPAMQRAMEIGSEVGAKETFLRQSDEIGNLIIRIANDFPTVYNEELATAMAERIKERGTSMTESHPSLTKRELEILRQLSTGRTLTVIASELHISQNTMKTHLKNLYKKMAADGRHSAVEKAKSSFLI